MAGYAKGGYIQATEINGSTIRANTTQLEMGMEATSLATAAAAIALGLDEAQAQLFMEQAYHLTRGMTPRGKYATLIELAYKIKQEI